MSIFAAQVVPLEVEAAVLRRGQARILSFGRYAFSTQSENLDRLPASVRLGHDGHDVGRVITICRTDSTAANVARAKRGGVVWLNVLFETSDPLTELMCRRGAEVSASYLFDRNGDGTSSEVDGTYLRHSEVDLQHVAILPPSREAAMRGACVTHELSIADDNWPPTLWKYLTRDEQSTISELHFSGVEDWVLADLIEQTLGIRNRTASSLLRMEAEACPRCRRDGVCDAHSPLVSSRDRAEAARAFERSRRVASALD